MSDLKSQSAILQYFNEKKSKHLFYSIILDIVGMLTLSIPVLGEGLDIIWAPISGVAIFAMYKAIALKARASIGGFVGFVEELLPFTDIVPTASLMWVYTYHIERDKTLQRIAKRRFKDVQIIENVTHNHDHPGLWQRVKAVFFPKSSNYEQKLPSIDQEKGKQLLEDESNNQFH